MKKNYTHIGVILDKSGSMGRVRNDVIGGFNSFIEDQKKEEGKASVSLVTFNSQVEEIYNFVDIEYITGLDKNRFRTGGSTSLYDAVGYIINSIGNSLSFLKEEERPEKVLIIIHTDGEENSSKEFTSQQIKDLIAQQEEKYKWKFIFLGANLEAVKGAETLGISKDSTMQFVDSGEGSIALYRTISKKTSLARGVDIDSVEYSSATSFSDKDLADYHNDVNNQ